MGYAVRTPEGQGGIPVQRMLFLWMQEQETLLRGRQPEKSRGGRSGPPLSAPGAGEGYRFSRAMDNPGFIGAEEIRNVYLPMGFSDFKIEGRGLGSALVLEFLLYYMTRPEYQIHVREEMYLDNMLDLF